MFPSFVLILSYDITCLLAESFSFVPCHGRPSASSTSVTSQGTKSPKQPPQAPLPVLPAPMGPQPAFAAPAHEAAAENADAGNQNPANQNPGLPERPLKVQLSVLSFHTRSVFYLSIIFSVFRRFILHGFSEGLSSACYACTLIALECECLVQCA